MEFDAGVVKVLGPLVAVAHTVVRKLEDDDVPAALRAIKAKSSRRLPPPLAKSLLGVLDDEAWLRAKVHEEGGPLDEAGVLFIDRPEGWEDHVRSLARAADADQLHQRIEAVTKERDEARAEVERRKEKQRATAKLVDQLRAELRSEREHLGEAIGAARAAADERVAAKVRELEARVAELEAERTEADELQRRIEWYRGALARRTHHAPSTAASRANPWVGDPIRKARLLDEIATAASGRAETVDVPAEGLVARFELPAGVRPDSGAAVQAVLEWPTRLTIAIDGYNVAAEGGVSLSDPSAAREFVRRIVWRLEAAASASHDVFVVYDSTDETEQKGTEIFVPWADEELRRLANLRDQIVVISNDREVISDTSAAGAIALWTTALLEWAR